MKRCLLLLAFVLLAADASAEPRYLIVPMVGDGLSRSTGFRPKYVVEANVPVLMAISYGRDPVYLVSVDDSSAQFATVAANADVLAVPADLSTKIGGPNVAAVIAKLEAMNIPAAGLVNANTTYRSLLAVIERIFRLAQKVHGLFNARLFDSGVTLDTTYGQLPTQKRGQITAAAAALGVNTGAPGGAVQLRQLLKTFSDGLPATVNAIR